MKHDLILWQNKHIFAAIYGIYIRENRRKE